jgi:septation ring formation regulator EzrA
MDEEVKKAKYKNMLNSLNRINNKLANLQENYKDDYEFIEKNVKIDDEMYNKKEVDALGDKIDKIKLNNERLMDSVSSKI